MSTASVLNLADVIEGLELTIEDWGDEAHGGNAFDLRVDPQVSIEPSVWLPHCLVASYLYPLTGSSYISPLRYEDNHTQATPDAMQFLYNVADAVDADSNPKRDWRVALDKTLAKWGLA